MKLAFRVDASRQIGSGHVMRCLTLAEALKDRGNDCVFICRAHPGNLNDKITQQGFAVKILPAPEDASWLGCETRVDARQTQACLAELQPDWLVVDHYALDRDWETILSPFYRKLLIIDDLGYQAHQADLLVNPNIGYQASDYQALLPQHCQMLLGPRYALLRPEFSEMRPASLERRMEPQLKKILITFGGVDSANVTGQILKALQDLPLPEHLQFTVILGQQSPWRDAVEQALKHLPWDGRLLVDVRNMAELMTEHDLCIGAIGGTTWERATLGLPGLVTSIAENQQALAQQLEQSGLAWVFHMDQLDVFQSRLLALCGDQQGALLRQQSQALAAVCQGQGARLVADQLTTAA